MRLAVLSPFVLAAALLACDEDPPPAAVPDAGPRDAAAADQGVPDLGPEDAGAPDAQPTDVGPEDTGAPDAGPVDQGPADVGPVDQGPTDGGPADAGPADASADAGQGPVDSDGDGILDTDEGGGAVDTDRDGTPDTLDTDSDGDGIPDAVEAGDADPSTPPVDTDGDGAPDFRDLDSDDDGITDRLEGAVDTDGDGTADYIDLDSDGDTIRDDEDGAGDPDMDGTPSFRDLDSDGDGLPDADEAGDASLGTPPTDEDGDGVPSFLDLDSDDDTLSDAQEGLTDTDGDTLPDFIDVDSDGDTLFDATEAGDADLATPPVDSDGDGVPDFRDLDSDGDTIRDVDEGGGDSEGDGISNYLDLDSDGDGVSDALEAGDADLATLPVDTDGDRFPDFRDLDSDDDGLGDAVEAGCPASTARTLADSDADGFIDPAEIAYGSNPCDGSSRIDDFYFVLPPLGPTSTAPLDFTNTQIDEADLAIAMDTSGSMSGEIANLRAGLSTNIIPAVRRVVPDVAFSVASYEDFPVAPFGDASAGDRPFRLGTRVTTNSTAAQTAVNGLRTRNGADFPESGQVTLHRIATGDPISWPGGAVPAFDPTAGRIPGVADGSIGGVGFRQDALPIVVQVTDAVSHTWRDYPAGIATATTGAVKDALSNIGARVVTVSQGGRPFNDLLCAGNLGTFFGAVDATGPDADWFELRGAGPGDLVQVTVQARAFGSGLDPMVAVANASTVIAMNDDASGATVDSQLGAVLTGAGPYYVAVTSFGDTAFSGAGQQTAGHYLATVTVNGANAFRVPSPTACRAQDAGGRAGATPLVSAAQATAPTDQAACRASCDAILGGVYPFFADFTFPYEIAEETGAVVPPCAWSAFGARPATCPLNTCCTGRGGAGVAPNAAGQCPLAFEISDTGAGLDLAMVSGIEALVRFSTFDLSTVVRGDPSAPGGVDTTCFVQSVVPVRATPPNTCGPTPTAVDRRPPAGQNDTWAGAVPGTALTFDVRARNEDGMGNPCVARGAAPQLFRAFIDVVADGVTVIDTRQVIVIVPPRAPTGGN